MQPSLKNWRLNGVKKFTLDLPEKAFLKIYSLIGSLVYDQEVEKDQMIDLSNFEKGIYNIQVSIEHYIYSKKLVLE